MTPPTTTMTRPYQITALVCLLIAAYVAYESIQLRYYTPIGPGPGFFPWWLSLILGLLALIMLGQATFGPTEPMPADFVPSRAGTLRIGAILAAIALSVILLDPLGFRLTTFALYVFLLTLLGRQSVLLTGAVALVGSFGVYAMFTRLLGIPLPIGFLGI